MCVCVCLCTLYVHFVCGYDEREGRADFSSAELEIQVIQPFSSIKIVLVDPYKL